MDTNILNNVLIENISVYLKESSRLIIMTGELHLSLEHFLFTLISKIEKNSALATNVNTYYYDEEE